MRLQHPSGCTGTSGHYICVDIYPDMQGSVTAARHSVKMISPMLPVSLLAPRLTSSRRYPRFTPRHIVALRLWPGVANSTNLFGTISVVHWCRSGHQPAFHYFNGGPAYLHRHTPPQFNIHIGIGRGGLSLKSSRLRW